MGSYVLRLLVEHGYHHIYALHRPSADRSLLLPWEKNINWVPGDVLDVVLMEEYLEDVDIVIHAAAMISYHQRDLRLMELTNVQGTANLVNAALTQGVKHFIMVSSIAALGGTHKDGTIDERVDWRDDLFHSQYAWSKYLSELEVHRGLAEGLGVSIVNPGVILGSLPWIHGTGQFFKRIHHGLKFYPQGTTGFVDVRDVAVAIKILVEKGPTQERFILTAENLSYRVVFNHISQALNTTPPPWPLHKPLLSLAIPLAWIAERAPGYSGTLTVDLLRNTSSDAHYVNRKSVDELGLQYRSIADSITETGTLFRSHYPRTELLSF